MVREEWSEHGFSVHAAHIVFLCDNIKMAERGAEEGDVHRLYVGNAWKENEKGC